MKKCLIKEDYMNKISIEKLQNLIDELENMKIDDTESDYAFYGGVEFVIEKIKKLIDNLKD